MAESKAGKWLATWAGLLGGLAAPAAVAAEPGFDNWQLGLQDPVTPVAEQMTQFHNLLLVITTLIVLVVLGLIIYVVVRFNEKRNPTPSSTTHNTPLEVIWTTVPVLILVIIAVPSFRLLYFEDVVPESEMTVTTIGHQWHWEYQYDDYDISYLSFMKSREDIEEGETWQLSVDNPLVLPANTTIRFQITASDVLHAFALPSWGIKRDAIPGQINETWAKVEEPGTYYGQCSELCGTNHSQMPIEVRVLPQDEFDAWVEQRQAQNGADGGEVDLAQAQ